MFGKIEKIVPVFTFLFFTCVLLEFCATMPAPDEDRYFDKDYARELAEWLAALAPQTNNPCPTAYNMAGYMNPLQKRNSELINSLLSLPKTMNDAGK